MRIPAIVAEGKPYKPFQTEGDFYTSIHRTSREEKPWELGFCFPFLPHLRFLRKRIRRLFSFAALKEKKRCRTYALDVKSA
ncbi:hypothetical protein AAC387_Pa09g2380 [Persea americana]